jgi:hypothetical protein
MIDEMQKVTPEITSVFVFKNDRKIVAKDKTTTEQAAQQLIDTFSSIEEKAQTIGGLESITMFGNYGEISLTDINDYHMATVCSKKADKKTTDLVINVLAPSIIRLVDQITTPLPTVTQTPQVKESTHYYPTEVQIDEEEAMSLLNYGLAANAIASTQESTTIGKETPTNNPELVQNNTNFQLRVGKLRSLMVRSNCIRIDNEIIVKWEKNCGNIHIDEVRIESRNGKFTTCKVESIRDLHSSGRGIIQMTDKLQSSLGVAEGEEVSVKPILKAER